MKVEFKPLEKNKVCWTDINGGQCFLRKGSLFLCLEKNELLVFNIEEEEIVNPIDEYGWDDKEYCYLVNAKVVYS